MHKRPNRKQLVRVYEAQLSGGLKGTIDALWTRGASFISVGRIRASSLDESEEEAAIKYAQLNGLLVTRNGVVIKDEVE